MPHTLAVSDCPAPSPPGYVPPPVVDLAFPPSPSPAEGAHAAVRAWAGHVAAGRIGVPAPAPHAGELRLASLTAILGRAA